jgi:hypothetical protein
VGKPSDTNDDRRNRTERKAVGSDPGPRQTGEAAVEAIRAGAAKGGADIATSADEANREAARRTGKRKATPEQ